MGIEVRPRFPLALSSYLIVACGQEYLDAGVELRDFVRQCKAVQFTGHDDIAE